MLLVSAGFIFMQKTAMGYTVRLDRVLFLPMSMYGIAAAVLAGMSVGDDYEGGFIRNKIFAGRERKCIYGSGLLATMIGGLWLYAVTVLFTAVAAGGLFERNVTFAQFLVYLALGAFTCAAYISIFYMTTMLIAHRAAAGISCMALAFLMLFLSLHANSMITSAEVAHPIWMLLHDINPTGQAAQLASMQCLNPPRFLLADAAWILGTNLIGICAFDRRNLK